MVQFCLKLLYKFSETIIKCVWMRMGRMEMDCNLQTLGSLDSFNFFLLMILVFRVREKVFI